VVFHPERLQATDIDLPPPVEMTPELAAAAVQPTPVPVAMPEPEGLSLATSIRAIETIAAAARIVGFGPTATMPRDNLDLRVTVDAVTRLTEAALGAR